jgi:hypothetical protein
MDCKLCSYHNDDLKRFSDHVKTSHGLSSEEYTIKVLHDDIKPTCAECGNQVRYVSFTFKKYCKDHSRLAMKEGGAIGGHAEAWNKGKDKTTDERIALQAFKMSGSGNHFYGRRHTQETLQKISTSKTLATTSIEERIIQRSGEFKLLTPLDEYRSRQQQYLLFECVKCGESQPKTLQAFERGSRCYKCYPVGKSNWELDVYNYVKSISKDAISGDRSALSPKEIDVYVPTKKFGIECHGLYWHSEAGKPEDEFDKSSHQLKARLAEEKNIDLFQIFEDEWRDKRPIVESMIQHRLGLHSKKCKTWSTRVVELGSDEQRSFFNISHVSGYTPAKICWGLKDRRGDVVSALSLRVPRHATKYENSIEIARFSNLPGISVPGALSKLLKTAKTWAKINGFVSIMTYVDRRIGTGKGYLSAGFELVGSTGPDYWYTDNELRYDRFKFRASDGKSEKQVAFSAGVSRIYGCGSSIMLISLKE